LLEYHITCNEDVKLTTITQLMQQQHVICVLDTLIYHILWCVSAIKRDCWNQFNSNTFNMYCQCSLLHCSLCSYRNCKFTVWSIFICIQSMSFAVSQSFSSLFPWSVCVGDTRRWCLSTYQQIWYIWYGGGGGELCNKYYLPTPWSRVLEKLTSL
jgi:hypothetical protein